MFSHFNFHGFFILPIQAPVRVCFHQQGHGGARIAAHAVRRNCSTYIVEYAYYYLRPSSIFNSAPPPSLSEINILHQQVRQFSATST
jgi:hypothetical protein